MNDYVELLRLANQRINILKKSDVISQRMIVNLGENAVEIERRIAELEKENKGISLALSLPYSNESSKQQSRIAELEKERDEHMAHAYYILETCMVFSPAHFEAHNLEQQAKGIEDFIQPYPVMGNYGRVVYESGINRAVVLRNKAKALKESVK
jgi:hypothetical protein